MVSWLVSCEAQRYHHGHQMIMCSLRKAQTASSSQDCQDQEIARYNLPSPMEMRAEQIFGGNLRLIKYKSNLDRFRKGNKSNRLSSIQLSVVCQAITPALPSIEVTVNSSSLKVSSNREQTTFPCRLVLCLTKLAYPKVPSPTQSSFQPSFPPPPRSSPWGVGKVTLLCLSHLSQLNSLGHISCPVYQ